jgi:hypothetical protein
VDAEAPMDRDDVVVIMSSLIEAHWKLDRILELLGDDEAEET